jgi:hypothetical protein
VEPWSADDPWQERRDPSPGWDEWPPPAPSADDSTVGDPLSPASDPWAESWADDVAGIPTSPPSELERYAEPASDVGFEPSPPPAFDATEAPSAPAFEPSFEDSEPQPATDAEPQPFTESQPAEAPRIEPWSPDSDPWGAAWTVPAAVEGATVDEQVAEGSALDDAGATDDTPSSAEDDSHEDGPSLADAAIVAAAGGAAIEAASGDEPPGEAPSAWDWGTAAVHEPEPAAEAEAVAEAPPELIPEADTDAQAEPEPIAEAEPEPVEPAEAEPEPIVEGEPYAPIWAAVEPESVAEAAEAAEAPEQIADAEAVPTVAAEATEPERSWEADLWPQPEPETAPEPDVAAAAAAAAAAGAEASDAEPEPSEADDGHLPEAAIAAAAIAASQPEIESRRPDVPWLDRPDQTEVYPTTWEPPPPPPPAARAEVGVVEPRRGAVRTTLGQAEPEGDDELAEEATTAEQAVPWLIGVILLLAGMVIVLLALIFAGDASLGGAGGSPTPSAQAFLPGSSGAVAAVSPTPRTSPSPSAEPSKSPPAVPQYGDLEMVYQGRSTALAPIYLLLRDFSVEAGPEVIAQDPALDVRRFAWSPDGTRGAALYNDVMVAIDPRVDIHRLSDGISAITFGAGPETVYAVRVVADGGNDVATILAVNQATGEERELDRVSYARPTIEAEASLTEAQFADDGGSVRLYWMHDDTLRLWILGAGSWTIDPAEGNASKLDEDALPVLWAQEGERRIRLAVDGTITRIHIVDRSGDRIASTSVTGRVSHLRWSPRGDQVVFTLGRPTSGGGVLQDLYLWNLGAGDDPEPTMITNTGAAFGAEWRGSQPRWEED